MDPNLSFNQNPTPSPMPDPMAGAGLSPAPNPGPMPNPSMNPALAADPMASPAPSPAADATTMPIPEPMAMPDLGSMTVPDSTPAAMTDSAAMGTMPMPGQGVETAGGVGGAMPGAGSITGGGPAPVMSPVSPVAGPVGAMSGMPGVAAPVSPVAQPAGPVAAAAQFGGLAATAPIMRPESLPEPDPVEEELNAPMKAAGPVPGSIGSAVSGAGANGIPATNPFVGQQPMNAGGAMPKQPKTKKAGLGAMLGSGGGSKNKTTLIALIAAAALIIIVLVIVLVMQLSGGGATAGTGGNPVASERNPVATGGGGTTPSGDGQNQTEQTGGQQGGETVPSEMICKRSMTVTELGAYPGAISGTLEISAHYDSDLRADNLELTEMVAYQGDDGQQGTAEVKEKSISVTGESLTTENMGDFFLEVNKTGEPATAIGEMMINYKVLAFDCEVL